MFIQKKEPKNNLERTKLLEDTIKTFKEIVEEVAVTKDLNKVNKLEARGASALQLMASQVGKASYDLYIVARKRRGELRRETVSYALSHANSAPEEEKDEPTVASQKEATKKKSAPKKKATKATK